MASVVQAQDCISSDPDFYRGQIANIEFLIRDRTETLNSLRRLGVPGIPPPSADAFLAEWTEARANYQACLNFTERGLLPGIPVEPEPRAPELSPPVLLQGPPGQPDAETEPGPSPVPESAPVAPPGAPLEPAPAGAPAPHTPAAEWQAQALGDCEAREGTVGYVGTTLRCDWLGTTEVGAPIPCTYFVSETGAVATDPRDRIECRRGAPASYPSGAAPLPLPLPAPDRDDAWIDDEASPVRDDAEVAPQVLAPLIAYLLQSEDLPPDLRAVQALVVAQALPEELLPFFLYTQILDDPELAAEITRILAAWPANEARGEAPTQDVRLMLTPTEPPTPTLTPMSPTSTVAAAPSTLGVGLEGTWTVTTSQSCTRPSGTWSGQFFASGGYQDGIYEWRGNLEGSVTGNRGTFTSVGRRSTTDGSPASSALDFVIEVTFVGDLVAGEFRDRCTVISSTGSVIRVEEVRGTFTGRPGAAAPAASPTPTVRIATPTLAPTATPAPAATLAPTATHTPSPPPTIGRSPTPTQRGSTITDPGHPRRGL